MNLFFSDADVDRIAYSLWLFDTDNDWCVLSWEGSKRSYRERAAFVVECLNTNLPVAA